MKKEIQLLTELERQVLQAVVDSSYHMDVTGLEGEEIINNWVWYINHKDVEMNKEQLSGAVSSCVKKGYVDVDKIGRKRNEEMICITKKGYNALMSN